MNAKKALIAGFTAVAASGAMIAPAGATEVEPTVVAVAENQGYAGVGASGKLFDTQYAEYATEPVAAETTTAAAQPAAAPAAKAEVTTTVTATKAETTETKSDVVEPLGLVAIIIAAVASLGSAIFGF